MMERNTESDCRKMARYVLYVIGPVSMDVVTYLANTCHEIVATMA
jgi:hypothetical protein